MDDIIFEKDYRETESAEYDKWCDEVFDRAVNCGMLKAYSEAMDKIPKIIVPEDKKNYEYLLERCDAFVKQHRGYIKGIVDYHRWHAEINMFLPFAEFDDSEDLAFLKEIAEKSQTVCFSPEEEGGIRVHIFINYFEELMSAEHKSYIEYDAIMQDKKLSALLGIPELSDEEKELALKMKGILDRIDEETRIDRTTAFRAVLDKMAKEPEENWSLHYMATLLEALLYFMLNNPIADESIAQFVVEQLNKQGVFQNLLQLSTLDNGKIKTASIVKFALRYLVTVTPAEGKQSLFNYWDGDKNALLAMDGNAIEEYVKFCVSTLRNYFGAIKKNLRKQWDDTDSKLLSVISINGFIIALTRQLSVNGVNDFDFYDRIFNGWTIDFSKDGFKYTSSQYRKFSTQILREVFQISDEIIATI